jgi:hypothetical protein
MVSHPLVGQDLVIFEDSRPRSDTPRSDTPRSAELLWTTYQPDFTTHKIQKRDTSLSLTGFEPAFTASERSQTSAL